GAHFGAALGLARAGDYAPAARLQLAGKAISEQAKDASRSELADAHALSSRALRLMGKSVEAGAAIEAALAKDSASSTALVAAGELLLDDGRLRDAVAKFKQAVPNAPSLPAAVPTRDIRFAAAAVLIEEGRADDGLALLPPLPAPGDKTDADARAAFWRGRAAELKTPADLEAAARAYESALKSDPRFVPATLQLAALLMRAKRPADAVAALRRAETAGSPAAALQVALGQALVTSGDLERAKKTFRDVLAKSPRYAPARLGLAAVLEAAGNFAGARAELDALYAQSPDTPGLRPRLAEVQVLLGERDKALALFQTEVDAGQASFATRLAAATLALQIGRVPAALALAEKLVVDAPQTPGALLLLGKVRRAGGDTAGALAELRRALSFESTPELHYEYARTLALGGKQEQALTEYEMASVLPAANIERARILIDRSDLERAVPLLEAALKQVPGQADAWLLMGNSYDRLGAQQKAVAAWRAAVKASSDNPEVHYRLGRWEMDQGQPGPALLHLRQAVAEIGKTDKISKTAPAPTGKPAAWIPDCYFQLGFAEKAKGNRPGAVAAFKRYLAVAAADAPSRPEVEQELGRLGSAP
ncbi:MAG TPA: tetratricopeptide repeat protein, partial [Polyangia bacterium]|nr:tetratricopeptide repeat protein [Polyangia bacterium]